MMFVCLARTTHPDQPGFNNGKRNSLFLFIYISFFLQSDGGREKRRKRRDRVAAQPSSAYLFSSLLSCHFFSFPPIYKSINIRSSVLCHCSVFKSLKRRRCLSNWQSWRCTSTYKSPCLKLKKREKKESCTKGSDRKAVNKSGYPRMSRDEVSH